MAGSRTWREYISDAGIRYSIQVDESNSNLVVAFSGVILCPIRTSDAPPLPIGLTPRKVHCYGQYSPKIKRNFVIGNPSFFTSRLARGEEYLYNVTPGNDPNGVDLWIITGYTGEKYTCPIYHSNADTGLIDGTPFMP